MEAQKQTLAERLARMAQIQGKPGDIDLQLFAETPAEIIAVLVSLAQIFFANNPTAQEIEAFLLAIAAQLGQSSGTIPAFKAGTTWFGPIPFGPNPPA